MHSTSWIGRLALVAALAVATIAAGCAGPKTSDYHAEHPAFDPRQFFDGTLDGWGMFQDRSGKVLRRFTVVIRASWAGDTGTLDEDFLWSDGERQKRVWTLHRHADGSYSGTAGDVIGTASGEVSGNALRWRYTMAIPVDGTVRHFDFDDWMFLIDDRVLLNRAVMSKLGIRVGDVTLSLARR